VPPREEPGVARMGTAALDAWLRGRRQSRRMDSDPGSRTRRAAGCLVVIALLWAAPAAHAAVNVRMDAPGGMSVVPEEGSKAEDLDIIGRLGPEGTVVSWDVESTGCISVGFTCVQSADVVDCHDNGPLSSMAECDRSAAGVRAQLRGGDDNLDTYRVRGDAVTVDMGDGDDTLNTDGREINLGEGPGG
jgi:hypothetical protein